MTEVEQSMSAEQRILNARVTIYLDGLIMTRFTTERIGQAGVVTTAADHYLRIIVRARGQLGQVWPPRDSSGAIPPIHYDSLRRMLALQIYVGAEEKAPFPTGTATPLTDSDEYSFAHVIDLKALHPTMSDLAPNVLAPLLIPQGEFYTAQRAKFMKKKGSTTPRPFGKKSSLTAVAIDYPLDDKGYLILNPALPDHHPSPQPLLLPDQIPLEPGARYEVIIQNAPSIVVEPKEGSATHFKAFYDALPRVAEEEQFDFIPEQVFKPGPRALPSSPPCTSPTYGDAGPFEWDPMTMAFLPYSQSRTGGGHHSHS